MMEGPRQQSEPTLIAAATPQTLIQTALSDSRTSILLIILNDNK